MGSLLLLGALLGAVVGLLPSQGLLHSEVPWLVAITALVGLAALSEVVHVRVPHGDTAEDLAFFEAVVVIGALVLPPAIVLTGALAGPGVVWLLQRRAPVKILFNLGMFGSALASLLLLAHTVAGPDHATLDARLVAALLAGTVAFALVNLVAMAAVMAVMQKERPLSWIRSEAVATLSMVGGNLGVALITTAIATSNPILLPFVGLPVLALLHSYKQSQRHAIERERANALVMLSSALTVSGGPADVITALLPALRKLFGADRADIRLSPEGHVSDGDRAVRLDLGAGVQGRLILGWAQRHSGRRGQVAWSSPDDIDEALLATTASAVSSVLRAARHLGALTEETSKLQAVIDHATDGIAVIDADGGLQVWSPSLRAIVGDPPPLSARAHHSDVVAGLLTALARDPEAMATTLRTLLPPARMQAAVELSLVDRNGEDRALQVSVSRIEGSVPGLAVLTVRDATEQRRVERMKADFVATVSHELRTPITPIKGYARLLATRGDRMEPARRLHALQVIEDRADHLGRLVDDLLMASRVKPTETSKLVVNLIETDLRTVVEQAVTAYPLLSDRIEVRVPAHAVQVRCDEVRAMQCLTNLISNAEKYSAPGTPIVVEMLGATDSGQAQVSVSDSGRGIPVEELARIFERFHRVEDPFTMSTGGSGLGLFIARELGRAMGGDITVESTFGKGSTFRLFLPMVTVGTPATEPGGARALAGH